MDRKSIYIGIICISVLIIGGNFFLIYKNNKNNEKLLMEATQIQVANEKLIKENIEKKIKYFVKNSLIIPKNPKDNKKVVLITIDDGPSKRSLDMVRILNKHNAKAIFFVNGINNEANKGVILSEHKSGFPIGNHTWSHLNLQKEKSEVVINKEIDMDTKLITEITGSTPRFFRPPYGAASDYVRKYVKKNNMIFMNWSESAKDWEIQSREKSVFIKDVTDDLQPGAIILIHEHPWSDQYLDELLTEIENRGYSFANPNQVVE